MPRTGEVLIPIDLTLRFVLFGLECVLGRCLSASEAEQLFRDAREDQDSEKPYEFLRAPGLAITGRVDEHEPESLWLRVEGPSAVVEALGSVVESAQFHAGRIQRSDAETGDPKKRWFDKG